MKELHEIKNDYARTCGAEDWHDHIKGMSAKDVDEEIYYLLDYINSDLAKLNQAKIFQEYAKKYPFLNELSEQEKSVIICMMYEQNNVTKIV